VSDPVTVDQFNALVAAELPFANAMGIRALSIANGSARVRLPHDDVQLRPGGTISGPAMFCLADVCMYAVVLGAIGHVTLAVTSTVTIDFLKAPKPGDLVATGTLLKLGRRLAVMRVEIHDQGGRLVAHATGTYARP
jgi:uncharacterized protein (TIGR00369 family)